MNNIKLATYLKRNCNNLDLIRIIAAAAVIYGHSFSFIPLSGDTDLIFRITGYYAADLAVKTFFFMSGLLVVNSLIERKDISAYIVHRFFRIMPGLIFVVIFTALVIGPIYTNLSVAQYFSNEGVIDYIYRMSTVRSWGTQGIGYYNLPGLFLSSDIGRNVNAPLWTLSVEVFSYIFILGMFLIGFLNRNIAVYLFIFIIVDSFLESPILFYWLPKVHDFTLMPSCFALGGLFAVYKDDININFFLPLGLFIIYFIFRGSSFDDLLFYSFFFTLVLFLSTRHIVNMVRIRHDLSYGVYLWGWPLQQVIISCFPNIEIHVFQLVSLLLAFYFAYVSWIFVEKPSINIGKKIVTYLTYKHL